MKVYLSSSHGTSEPQSIRDIKDGTFINPVKCELPDDVSIEDANRRIMDMMYHKTNHKSNSIELAVDYKIGGKKQYLDEIFEYDDIPQAGESIVITAPTGAGKTQAVLRNIKRLRSPQSDAVQVIILINRYGPLIQFIKDYYKVIKGIDMPIECIESSLHDENINIMTYQRFSKHSYQYKGQKILLILDEYHCLVEDATFSAYPEKIMLFLKANLDNTARIYLSATPDAVMPVIADLESISKTVIPEITWDSDVCEIYSSWANYSTRVKMVYSMEHNWDYLQFRFYNPRDQSELISYIKSANERGDKSMIFINDISKGKAMQEKLGEAQHIYSDEDKCAEIAEIAKNERFADKNLITTKVAENGLSLHDEELNLIVVETLDPVTLQQVIGRARVNRKKPRDITVLIPDYTYADLGNAIASVSQQLKKAEEVADNPQRAMAYVLENPALVYYDFHVEEPFVNMMAIKALEYQLEFLKKLRETPEDSHAFARKVLEIYGKNTDITDDMFLDYDNIADYKAKVNAAFGEYKVSEMDADALEKLKIALKDICNFTRVYNDGKPINNNIQIGTVNAILKAAGMNVKINPKREVYDISTE